MWNKVGISCSGGIQPKQIILCTWSLRLELFLGGRDGFLCSTYVTVQDLRVMVWLPETMALANWPFKDRLRCCPILLKLLKSSQTTLEPYIKILALIQYFSINIVLRWRSICHLFLFYYKVGIGRLLVFTPKVAEVKHRSLRLLRLNEAMISTGGLIARWCWRLVKEILK